MQVTSGSGTDSLTWSFDWGTDSLVLGENFVCVVPLEMDAAVTNNEGLGSPFAGNLVVCPLYRIPAPTGCADERTAPGAKAYAGPTIVRGILHLPEAVSGQRSGVGSMLDISGRRVLDLKPGPNDVRRLAPGVYFVRVQGSGVRGRGEVGKVVITQ
jgi:hypothetical protein